MREKIAHKFYKWKALSFSLRESFLEKILFLLVRRKAEWISAWGWWGMLWDDGTAYRADEGEKRCNGAVESGKLDVVGKEDE